MEKNELYHHGVLGMKWGVRRYQRKDGSLTPAGKKRRSQDSTVEDNVKPKQKSVKEMSDSELREKINRLNLEKQYGDLTKNDKKTSKVKAFVTDVLEKSGKNIATQLATYAMGALVNKAFSGIFNDDAIVNPKKGQKDK